MNGMIYTRVSTKEQVFEKTSLDSQLRECQREARKRGVTITEDRIFREEGESAKVVDRTELQRLLDYARTHKGKVEVLYIWKIDRLSRNLGDYYGLKVLLSQLGVKIVSVTEPIDDDPVGRFLEAILAAAAQFDNEIRAVRTVNGMRSRVEQGSWPHTAPVGYLKQDRRVIPDPEYADKIKDILMTFAKGGHTVASIGRYAAGLGITTKRGRAKSDSAMRSILQNPIYAGYLKSKLVQDMVKGLHKPLVSFDVIQENIDILNGTKKNYVLQNEGLYPLKNILLCSNCGYSLTGSSPKGRNGTRHPYYSCNRKSCKTSITGKRTTIPVEKVHDDFRGILSSITPINPKIATFYKELVIKAWKGQYGQTLDAIERLNAQILETRKMKQTLVERYLQGKLNDDEKEMQANILDGKLMQYDEDLHNAESYREVNEKVIDNAMVFISDPTSFWNQADNSIKLMVQKLLFPKGIVYDFETGFGTIQQIESYLLIKKIADKSAKNSNLVAATGIEPVTLGL